MTMAAPPYTASSATCHRSSSSAPLDGDGSTLWVGRTWGSGSHRGSTPSNPRWIWFYIVIDEGEDAADTGRSSPARNNFFSHTVQAVVGGFGLGDTIRFKRDAVQH
ncbi:hypothetical protein QJS10_CPB17g02056 [Acorus calamus]|uniref:Uncharacterized protein n=1 Tax=Acorus calamus TaxID=4465 RepID=A0AAV9CWN1_ACOCL|nr:hypothetical protein QJS10_CPB17g02056 [Acorus calamus]